MIAALLTAVALVVCPTLVMRDRRREKARRAAFFSNCVTLFQSYRIVQEGHRFPTLEGKYKGLRFRLEPVLDDMGVRKVPSLWLKATLLVVNPERGVLDFLVRPQGNEFYSASHDLPKRFAVPTDWPQHAILAGDAAEPVPPLAVVAPHMSAFQDPRMKELVITPRGVRFVYQAAQAERSEYLVLRQSRFATARVEPALVRELLDRLIALAADLDGVASQSAPRVA